MRKWLGLLLILTASLALWPSIQQAVAYTRGTVGFGGSSSYVITAAADTNQLVRCSVPLQILVKNDKSVTSTFVSCRNNTGSPIVLNWTTQVNSTWADISGSDTLLADGTDHCVSMTLKPGPTDGTQSITIRGATASTADFYTELYFTASVKLQNGASQASGGCQ